MILLLAASAFLTPPAMALGTSAPNVVTITLRGDNAGFHPDYVVSSLFPLPGGVACGSTGQPGSFEVQCVPQGYTTCLAWQVSVATSGVGGFVTGSARCDGAPASVAGVPKPGSATGPLVLGPAPMPLTCGVTWVPGPQGGFTVNCVFVIT